MQFLTIMCPRVFWNDSYVPVYARDLFTEILQDNLAWQEPDSGIVTEPNLMCTYATCTPAVSASIASIPGVLVLSEEVM